MVCSHFLPSVEADSSSWARSGAVRVSARASLCSMNRLWHSSRCVSGAESSADSDPSRGASVAFESAVAAWNARGAHVLNERSPRPPSLMGNVIRAGS